ncbi:hypothetical protein VTN00DRAFT_6382 [Thermoascus crustaceus]|uniref:uncharacterized protein n=1 Tax=Thermoascus crustaceus TaxID=5088 RepID=UPI0037441342
MQQSRLLTIPREVLQRIIFFAYKAYDSWHLSGPVIRVQAVHTGPQIPGQSRILKGASLPREERCQLIFANRQLHDDSEYVLYTKFEFLFETKMDLRVIRFFLKGLSKNARNLMRHISVTSHDLLFSLFPDLSPCLVQKDLALWSLWFEVLMLRLPNLRTKKLFLQCSFMTTVARNTPAFDEQLLRATLFQDLVARLSSMGLSYLSPRPDCILQVDFHSPHQQRQQSNV